MFNELLTVVFYFFFEKNIIFAIVIAKKPLFLRLQSQKI
jgi:hypothetical protein